MIIIPTRSNSNWSCYFFDFKVKQIHVLDPLYDGNEVQKFHACHEPTVQILRESLAKCIESLFTGWQPLFDCWQMNFVAFQIKNINW